MVCLFFERLEDFTGLSGLVFGRCKSDAFSPFLTSQKYGIVVLWLIGKMIHATNGLNCICIYPGLTIALCQHGEIGFVIQILQVDDSS